MKLRSMVVLAGLAAASLSNASAANVLAQDFENFGTLGGWTFTNNSSPRGSTGWFQGNGVLTAQAGTSDSYVAANINNTTLGGNTSSWMILPTLTLNDGDTLSFYTRSTQSNPDRLEVRFSSNGSSSDVGSTSTSVGDFTNLLLSINPTLVPGGYPSSWTQYSVALSGLGGPVSGRFALRYAVTDTSTNGAYIGVDTISVDEATAPEPSTVGTFLGGLSLVAMCIRNKALRKP